MTPGCFVLDDGHTPGMYFNHDGTPYKRLYLSDGNGGIVMNEDGTKYTTTIGRKLRFKPAPKKDKEMTNLDIYKRLVAIRDWPALTHTPGDPEWAAPSPRWKWDKVEDLLKEIESAALTKAVEQHLEGK